VRAADGLVPPAPLISLDRLTFLTPDRTGLPPLGRYSKLRAGPLAKTVGYTEASRGCKHLCRHCPVVPVYQGQFRVVAPDVVLADIRQQVAAGAGHITFGDPDFFNGPGHAAKIVTALHEEFPALTYDVTIKIEHLLQQQKLLPLLKETGCLFVVSAVESIDDEVLQKLDKGHTRADFIQVAREFRTLDLALSPTFIPFTPWTTIAGYRQLLELLAHLDLVDEVGSIQLALRLLIPNGSRMLELAEIRKTVKPFDPIALTYPWRHSDPAVDTFAHAAFALVAKEQKEGAGRLEIFKKLWHLAGENPLPVDFGLMPRSTVPYLEEPWYC
jgi:hypothetical protein